jgi:hypothetical protein
MDMRETLENAQRRAESMWTKRQEKEREWTAYSRAFAPARGRFSRPADRSEARDKSPRRKNSAPMKIAEEFAAGMQSGLASPSRLWFHLGLFDERLMEIERVKAWVSECEKILMALLHQSRFYDQFTDFEKEQGVFGTAAMFIEEDDEDVFFCKTLTAGEYAIDADYKGNINRFCRRLAYTAQQLAEDFGISSLPRTIQDTLRDSRRRDAVDRYEVIHLIQPNAEFQADRIGPRGMKWQSLWWLSGNSEEPYFLRVSGYNEFPVIAGRWRVIGGDVYGREHPAEAALDDAVTLQILETDAREALERMVKPPIIAPQSLTGKVDNRPNKLTLYEPVAGQPPVIQPLFQVNFDFKAAEEKIAMLNAHIERAFYVDLFRMWASDMRIGRTATETEAREQEKMYILAPVTLRQTSEVLDKAIIRTFRMAQRAGRFPPVPEELARQSVKIEYVSEFALLQKRANQGGIETLLYFTNTLAQLQASLGEPPEVVTKLDMDQIIDDVSEMYGLDGGIVLGDDAVARIREDRATQMRQQQEAQMAAEAARVAPGVAKAAKDLSETRTGGGTALDEISAALEGGGGM